MASLIKCARCGKKPGVKSNSDRDAWAAVTNAPCNERGGPRYDHDDGLANSIFTSGLRECGAQETDWAAQKRTASAVRPSGGQGPERFFYDKSSYTGTHARGGPERVAKGGGSSLDDSWKRPSELDSLGRLTLLRQKGAGEKPSSPLPLSPSQVRSSSLGATLARPTSRHSTAGTRPSSRGAGTARLVGPERFFYDKSSYTGTHARGGPSSVAKGGGTSCDQSWKRPL